MLVLSGLAACAGAAGTPEQRLEALRAGRDAALPCQERFHEESQTYADCVRYVSQQRLGAEALRDWRKLGALSLGWVHADLVGQQGEAPAALAARQLLNEALDLQQRLGASDAQLCELVQMDCALLAQQRRDLLRQ